MNTPTDRAVFLARASYRQRRLRDALRMLPVLGIILWLLPLLWQADGGAVSRTALALQFVFGVWVFLIVIAAILARLIKPQTTGEPDEDLS